jgi:hypothetical protein
VTARADSYMSRRSRNRPAQMSLMSRDFISLSGHGFNRAVSATLPVRLQPLGMRLSLCHCGISPTRARLLDFPLTNRKRRASHFLIDNFERSSASSFSRTRNFRHQISSSSNRQSPQLETLVSHRKQRTGNFLIAKFRHMLRSALTDITPIFPFSTFGFESASVISNRPSPRLEMPVSHRKQKTGPLSNRPQIAHFNSVFNSRRPCVQEG